MREGRRPPLISCLAAALVAFGCGGGEPQDPLPDLPGIGGAGGDPWSDPACDRDADGVVALSCGGPDCNDRNPAIFPGSEELCDGVSDEDCDGTIDEDCECVPGDMRSCYPLGEDHEARNIGACADGVQRCGDEGTWGACDGAVEPATEDEACDGIDQDCDGVTDELGANACGICGEVPAERCGNSLDDDCNGFIDDAELCDVNCGYVDPASPTPAGLACCFGDPDVEGTGPGPVDHTFTCLDWPGLEACEDRACLDFDSDPNTTCIKRCTEGVCVCGAENVEGVPVAHEGCGFVAPCARMGCDGRADQPCYSGPPQTLGVGVCRGGVHSCEEGEAAWSWGACEGEVLPGVELCGNRLDDDCDGLIDETGADGGRCPLMVCPPEARERCGNGLDDDCDGFADEGCIANADSQDCYTGPEVTREVGACSDGLQQRRGVAWGPCEGEQLPFAERCGDGIDSDCNGRGGPEQEEDGACCIASPGGEVCNGVDDDCDGLADEGLVNACGTCGGGCFTHVFADPGACSEENGTDCEGVVRDPRDPAAIVLDGQKWSGDPFLYVPLTDRWQVAKFDVRTGELLWSRSTGGRSPVDIAVGLDDTIWVGHGHTDIQGKSQIIRMDSGGNVLCAASVSAETQALAIDRGGNLWASSFDRSIGTLYLWLLDGEVPPLPDPTLPPPACPIVDISPEDPLSLGRRFVNKLFAAELAIDRRGILWTSSVPAIRLDTVTRDFMIVKHAGMPAHTIPGSIAIADDHTPWMGGYDARWLHANPPYDDGANLLDLEHQHWMNVLHSHEENYLGPVTIARDGTLWGVSVPQRASEPGNPRPYGLVHLNPQTWATAYFCAGVSAVSPLPANCGLDPLLGVAEDVAGRIWTVKEGTAFTGDKLLRFDPVSLQWDEFGLPIPGQMAGVSSMTNVALSRMVSGQGVWTQVFDAGWSQIQWARLTWEQELSEGGAVDVYVRFADTKAELATSAAFCGPFTESPADLSACAEAEGKRYAQVQLYLRAAPGGDRPAVRDVTLSWARP